MADFVTVLRRAVENLEVNNEQERRALYDKAKTALLGQLRSLDPPLSPAELERQSHELDDAIEQLEAEYAEPAEPDGGQPAGHYEAGPALHQDEPASPQPPVFELQQAEPEPPRDPFSSFQSTVAETAALGTATSTAAQTARHTYEAFEQDAPYADPYAGAPEAVPQHASEGVYAEQPPHEEWAYHSEPHDEPLSEPPADAPAGPASAGAAPHAASTSQLYTDEYDDTAGRGAGLAVWAIVFLMIAAIAGVGFWQRDALVEVAASFGGTDEGAVPVAEETKMDERVPTAGAEDEAATDEAPTEQAAAEDGPQPGGPALPDEAARIAQAMLVEEGQGNSTNSLDGTVDWALLDDPEAPEGAEKVIRGTVDIPDRDMSLTLAIRRNTDPELPATHTVELLFDVPDDFAPGGIAGVAGLVMKANPQSTGQPLIGAVVPVTDDFYLLGLSESDYDRSRNINEMKRRSFIDVPLAYSDESRAILSIAKGQSGQDVFEQAFEAWGQ